MYISNNLEIRNDNILKAAPAWCTRTSRGQRTAAPVSICLRRSSLCSVTIDQLLGTWPKLLLVLTVLPAFIDCNDWIGIVGSFHIFSFSWSLIIWFIHIPQYWCSIYFAISSELSLRDICILYCKILVSLKNIIKQCGVFTSVPKNGVWTKPCINLVTYIT